jgi:hypothetical protein
LYRLKLNVGCNFQKLAVCIIKKNSVYCKPDLTLQLKAQDYCNFLQ